MCFSNQGLKSNVVLCSHLLAWFWFLMERNEWMSEDEGTWSYCLECALSFPLRVWCMYVLFDRCVPCSHIQHYKFTYSLTSRETLNNPHTKPILSVGTQSTFVILCYWHGLFKGLDDGLIVHLYLYCCVFKYPRAVKLLLLHIRQMFNMSQCQIKVFSFILNWKIIYIKIYIFAT